MTILPKKKTTKDKNEPETTEHTKGHHTTTSETRHEKPQKVNRARNSPTRWQPSTSRDDKHTGHDSGGSFESLEAQANHNKRRHRSSPHRSVRKHRGHCSATATTPTPDPEFDEGGYNSEDEYNPPSYPDNIEELERFFENTMKEKKGWIIKKMGEDGACLFRAVADQVYGDQEMHSVVRRHCVEYMTKNSDYFSQYVTEDFTTYLNRKKMDHCHGNHVEMQAISEVFNRPIEVYQYSREPINTFNCSRETDNEPIRITYHRNVHYNSLVDPYKATIGVGLGLPGFQPGAADKNLMGDAVQQSERFHLEKCMLEDKLRETDWEVTQETIEEQVARESYLQWLRDNECNTRARRQESPKSASATCSSSGDGMFMDTTPPAEFRKVCSPRPSTHNSPQRLEVTTDQGSPKPSISNAAGSGSPKSSPHQLDNTLMSNEPLGATASNTDFVETNSLMNHYDPANVFGYQDWNEDDILAQVMAQSQQEYLDTLKKKASTSTSSFTNPLFSTSTSSHPNS